MPNTSIIDCCLAMEATDALSPPLKPMAFPMALPWFLTQAFPSWGAHSPRLLYHHVSGSPNSPLFVFAFSYKHTLAEWNPEKASCSTCTPQIHLFETWGACVCTENGRCVASWCYKTAQLSTVLREKKQVLSTHNCTLSNHEKENQTKAKTGESPTKDFNTHAPSGVTLSVSGSLLLWLMPWMVASGCFAGCSRPPRQPPHGTAFTQPLCRGEKSRRKSPFLPSTWGTAQIPVRCCNFSVQAGCTPHGELKRRLLPACDESGKSYSNSTIPTDLQCTWRVGFSFFPLLIAFREIYAMKLGGTGSQLYLITTCVTRW